MADKMFVDQCWLKENNCSREVRAQRSNWVPDLTFSTTFSPKESKYIVKAVGNILLEIQALISSQGSSSKTEQLSSVPEKRPDSSVESKRLKYGSRKTLSDHEIDTPLGEVCHPSETTYHRRVLDEVVSKNKKPVDRQNGSLDWKHLESNRLPQPDNSHFHRPELVSKHRTSSKLCGLGDVYSINRAKLSISAFVSSFYKHYSIVSPSSFVLSLIFIDRFIKAQCKQGLQELTKFSIKR